MTSETFEAYGAQDLNRQTIRPQYDVCDVCHTHDRGHWYQDDREGGSEWFLCPSCVRNIRKKRNREGAENG